MGTAGITGAFRTLLGRLVTFKVEEFGSDSASEEDMVLGRDRETADLNEAHVASSLLREHFERPVSEPETKDDLFFTEIAPNRHTVVLDIDHQAHLVESSTPGHYHLYVEVPGGIEEQAYFAFLRAAAKIGLIQEGYAETSIKRGHSDVRLPWVSKGSGEHTFVNHGSPPGSVAQIESIQPSSTEF